jgi:hypothetical protein
MPANTKLSSTVTVSQYLSMEDNKEVEKIVAFVKERFCERYINPMRVDKTKKSGFAMMALSCLMIETLESFYQGWPTTNRKSELAFCKFFDRNPNFTFIRGFSSDFYKHIRCGILHQAEVTDGWRILRSGQLFDPSSKSINANLFLNEVESALNSYCDALKTAAWEDTIWENFKKKMKAVCDNC